jgi:hypothetical protein
MLDELDIARGILAKYGYYKTSNKQIPVHQSPRGGAPAIAAV